MFAYTIHVPNKPDLFRLRDTLIGGQAGEYFGTSLASGYINGDAFEDLVIGAPQFTNERPGFFAQNEGRVFVYFGSSEVFFLSNKNLLNLIFIKPSKNFKQNIKKSKAKLRMADLVTPSVALET